MTSDNAVPLTPEFVERVFKDWLRERGVRLLGIGEHDDFRRDNVALSFGLALNKAEQLEEAPDPGDAIDATTKIVGGAEWRRCPCLCHKDLSILH